jgi:hypothetical protein
MEQFQPEAESCDNPGSDDDCNGAIDDVPGLGSPCVDDMKLGACSDGTLRCLAGTPAPVCVGREPTQELCDALDQDCDGNPINTFDLNSRATCGSCEVSCATTQLCCGGACVEPESLETDAQRCGSCDRVCGSNQYCCQGKCLNRPTASTSAPGVAEVPGCNCSSDCGSKACCGTRCVDLVRDPLNCGACGYECGAAQQCKGGTCKQRP